MFSVSPAFVSIAITISLMAEQFSKTLCSAFASLKRTISLEVKSVGKCFSFSFAWNTRASYQTQLKWWTLTNHFLLCFYSLSLPMTFCVNDKKTGKRRPWNHEILCSSDFDSNLCWIYNVVSFIYLTSLFRLRWLFISKHRWLMHLKKQAKGYDTVRTIQRQGNWRIFK